MQTTLVSHYGEKPEDVALYVKRCQDKLKTLLPYVFTPYELAQVHGTIIGLEGCQTNNQIENMNFREYRKEIRLIEPSQLLAFLRSSGIPSFDVQIGGYAETTNYGFHSQGKHPYLRTFSIQGLIAVAMGWPVDGSNVLDDFRRSFNQFNVLHKWHKNESDIDNDFFLVLGQIDRESVTDARIADVESRMRQYMANTRPVTVTVNQTSLQLICYLDTQLPLNTSRAYAVNDSELTSDRFLQCYD